MRILVAEDDAVLAMLLGDILEGLGHTVCQIESTEDGAVQAAVALRPDLVIMDARLRGGSGLLAMQRILREGPVAHLFMSGDIIDSLGRADVVLRKPFNENDLVLAIKRATDQRIAASA